MSGICAVLRKQDDGRAPATLSMMCAALALHPSARTSTAVDGCAGLGVAARYPHQQIFTDANCIAVCDAELYNERELRELAGPPPASDAPAAALVAALYARLGPAFVEKLRGDFSLLLWDRRQKTLLAAVDGFSIRPLVYYQDSRVLLVATRIDTLLASGEVPRDINPRALAKYVNYTVNLAPDTVFQRVDRLLPGHLLLASARETQSRRYWDMQYAPDRKAGERELASRLESAVAESVAAHCKNDAFPGLGAFLSGGTDSSTVVGMMTRLGRGAARSFSIGFEEQRFNELEYARITARHFQADHHEYLVNAADCMDAIPEMVHYFDEPYGNSSAIPTYFCARLAAQNGVRALLAGDGGDELFGGNERYLTDKIFGLYQGVPRLLRKGLVEPALSLLPPRGLLRTARSYIRRSNLPQPERFFSYNPLAENPAAAIFEDDFVAALGDYDVLETCARHYWQGPARDHLDRLLYLDVKITLADNDLLKVTRMSELAGVRPRFPFLDRDVAAMSGSIPARLKVKGFTKRYLFKRAFRNLLPIEVIRKTKHGFGIPVAVWMKTDRRMRELTRDVLLSPRAFQRGYIRREYIEELFRKHESDETAFYGDTLWTFLSLELWFRQFVDQPMAAAV
jgi:asparagine synthase (glutamine-hydrolysing)